MKTDGAQTPTKGLGWFLLGPLSVGICSRMGLSKVRPQRHEHLAIMTRPRPCGDWWSSCDAPMVKLSGDMTCRALDREIVPEGWSIGENALALEVRRCLVSLTTAHKILILAAVLLFFGYALWELRQYSRLGEVGALLRSAASLLGAVGFGVYLRGFVRSLRHQR